MSATTAAGFKWLDLLEKEFDKSFVSIDQQSRNVAEEFDLDEMYDTQRRLLANLGNCFVQLVHKSQTIFQINAKLEAEMLNYKEELNAVQKTTKKVESEKSYLLYLLQNILLENSILKSKETYDQKKLEENVQLQLANDLASFQQKLDLNSRSWIDKCRISEYENKNLRQQVAELESELVGARLDAKYLDKELAGRIQQIQILLASNASQEHKQQVWAQIEAEMHLQRSKTIANMCYSKQKLKDNNQKTAEEKLSPNKKSESNAAGDGDHEEDDGAKNTSNGHAVKPSSESSKPPNQELEFSRRNRIKQVHLHMHDSDELGMAILGGVEHGLPIIISEVFPNTAVGRSKKIYAGDVILGVNGDSFTEMGHNDAVRYLSSLRGSIRFDLENTIEADIDEVCDMEMRFYQFHLAADDEDQTRMSSSGSLPNKIPLHYPGKAKDVRKSTNNSTSGSVSSTTSQKSSVSPPRGGGIQQELPQVHSSPTKNSSNSSKPNNITDEEIV